MESFEEIYTLYRDDVYRFILKLTGYDRLLAEEITQEAFYRAFKDFSKFRGECNVKTWICGIGRNVFYKFLSSEKRQRAFEESLGEKLLTRGRDSDLAAGVETAEKCRIVKKIISELGEPAKTIAEYRLFGEISYSEIAKAVKIREGTAKVIFSRAKVKIISEMKEVYGYEI